MRRYELERGEDGQVRRMFWLGDVPSGPKRRRLRLGEVVKPYGKVAAISIREGERYYFFIASDRSVALMPADCVEPVA